MTTKTVKQYKCDFCGKKKYSAGTMRRHERGCTLNPNRVCGMCAKAGVKQSDIKDLTDALLEWSNDSRASKAIARIDGNIYECFGLEIPLGIRIMANECPACLLAAIRQFDRLDPAITRGTVFEFDFKAEKEAFWALVNQQQIGMGRCA